MNMECKFEQVGFELWFESRWRQIHLFLINSDFLINFKELFLNHHSNASFFSEHSFEPVNQQ